MLLDIIFRGMFRSVTSLCRAAPSTLRSLYSAASPPASVWSLGKLNHVAIAVPNLKAATSLYRDMLGATVSPPEVCSLVFIIDRSSRSRRAYLEHTKSIVY